jgi:DnaJ family protein A protein 2
MDGLNADGLPGMNDLFAQFFSGNSTSFGFDFGPGHGGRRRGKGDDVLNYDVTLEDLYNGKSVKMNMEKEVVCALCKG